MTVSHELRTPLTAIRGHVGALREGVVTDDELRAASLTVIAAEAERLERLVGDVLDLAKLDAHRFTVLQEEVDMERLVDRAYVDLQRGGAAARDRLPARGRGQAGDRLGRRPRPADHHEPALERLPLDARRRPRRPRAERDRRQRLRRRRRQRAGDRAVASGSGSSGRSGRAAAAAPASASRSRASSPSALGGRISLESSAETGQPLRADAARTPQIASARGRRARARRAAAPPLARAGRARGAAPAAVVEEPACLRRPRLRGQARRSAALAGGLRLLRRLLRGLERVVPGQRRARPARRPAAPGQALAADRPR